MDEQALVRYRSMVYDSARWTGFSLRPDDIVVSTPPKCGTTWTQMICVLLILQTPDLDRPLSRISPWLDMLTRPRDEVVADLAAQSHRRCIKTHTPPDGLPWDDDVTYICVGRDPRDTALSMFNHRNNMDSEKFMGLRNRTVEIDLRSGLDAPGQVGDALPSGDPFWAWVDNDTPPTESASSLLRTLCHIEMFWDRRDDTNIVMLHYDDLQADLGGQMHSLAARLGIDVPADRWDALVEAATFEHMRGNADRVVPSSSEAMWRDNQEFFHRGTSGQWRDLLDDADLVRYAARVDQLIAPDLSEWLHRGPVLA